MLVKNNFQLGMLSSGLAVVLVCACTSPQGQSIETPPEAGDSSSSSSTGNPSDAAGLPPEHPPLPQTRSMTVAPVPADAGTGEMALTWTPPSGWTVEPPSSTMRRAQYRVSGPGGDAECVVYYFGPGQGGTPMDVAQLWADQFTQPDGRPSRDLLETRTIAVNGITVLMSAISGTFASGSTMGGQSPETLPGYMLLGAAAEGPDTNWFFKFTGPQATVEAQRVAFEEMIGSLHRGS